MKPSGDTGALDVVLHVGTTKTGSTSIQHFLRENRSSLAARGWLYPRSPGNARHAKLGYLVKSDEQLARTGAWVTGGFPDPATFRRRFARRLVDELTESGLSRAILSEEYLWQAPRLSNVRELTERIASTTRVVVYLRRQDDHLVSAYQQSVRGGEVRRIDEFARVRQNAPAYDYATRLRVWQREVQPAELVVRRFESASFTDGSLHQDFLTAAGVEVAVADLELPGRRNESLDADAVEFVRIFNLHRIENEGLTPTEVRNGKVTRRLAALKQQGPTLTVSAPVLDAVMERYAESNRAVEREYFGSTGELFTTPRRTTNTTTVQRLDPARLDAYFDVLEIPEEKHAAIRRIAEREAAVGILPS